MFRLNRRRNRNGTLATFRENDAEIRMFYSLLTSVAEGDFRLSPPIYQNPATLCDETPKLPQLLGKNDAEIRMFYSLLTSVAEGDFRRLR